MKLKTKFLLLTLPMILVPLLLLSSLSYLYVKETIYRSAITQLDSSLLQVSSDVVARLKNATATATLISQVDTLKPHTSDIESLTQHSENRGFSYSLMDIIKGFPNYSEISIFSDQGVLLESVSHVFDEYGFQTQFIQQMIEAKLDHLEEIWVTDQSKQLFYSVAHAIKLNNEDHQTFKNRTKSIGYLLISVDMSFLNDLIIEGVEKQGIDYYLANSQGDIIFSPSAYISASHADSTAPASINLKPIIASRSTSINYYSEGDQTYFGGYKRLTQGLYLVGLITEEDMLLSSSAYKVYLFWFLVVVMLMSIVIIRAQVNSVLTYPVDVLRKLVAKFKKGEYEHDATQLGSDELKLLADDVKTLSQGLSENSETVKNLAYYDSLTGLPNRITFDVNLSKALNHCERTNSVLALLFIDLDNFKEANDIYGHQAGDELLKETAIRLESCLRSADLVSRKVESTADWAGDIVVRLGGDEFTIILTDIEQAHQASMVAQRVVDVLSHPFNIADADISIGASIGIAMYPVDGTTTDRLIKSADLAMYEAKQKGRNNYKFFTKALNEAVAKRLEIESSLRKAIEEDEFFLVFQPKVRLSDGEVVSVEALVRWQHPQSGVLLPEQFMGVAEDSSMVIDIGRLVLNKVCQQLNRWRSDGREGIKVSINLSSLQLLNNGLVGDLKDALRRYDLTGSNIEIELDEKALLANERSCIDLLNQFKIIGVESSLDNFGSGVLSLDYIRKFPIKQVKFDRRYIESLNDNFDEKAVLNALFELAKALSFDVVVEGVETQMQLYTIQKMPCDYAQGYFFTEPVRADELTFNYMIPSSRGNHTVF